MRTISILILIVSLNARLHSRPLQLDEKNDSEMEESEYERDIGAAVDDSGADEDVGLKDRETSEQNRHFLEMNGNTYLHRNVNDRSIQTDPDVFSDYNPVKNKNLRNDKSDYMKNSFDEYQTVSKDRLSNRYIENNNDANDQQETAQRLANRDDNSNRFNNVLQGDAANKNNIEFRSVPKEEGEMLFENNREQLDKIDKKEHNNYEAFDSNLHSQKYYNPEQTEDRVIMYHNNPVNGRLDSSRNRRQAQDHNQGGTAHLASGQDEREKIKNNNEDEESAIKRHIVKMTGEELEELLNSLSEEKRELLKKIIDNADTTENGVDTINKREITKKAGAIGENSYNEGGLSDSSKIREGNPSVDMNNESSVTQKSETTETNKPTETQTENNDISSSKNIDTNGSVNKADISSPTDGTDQRMLDVTLNSCAPIIGSNKNQAEVVTSGQMPFKDENKRETNVHESAGIGSDDVSLDDANILQSDLKDTQDSLNDQGYFCSQDDDLSQLIDDEAQLRTDQSKTYKREIQKQADLSDSIKSLEESFPNSEAYSDESGPYTGTLIRVKRRNSDPVIKKRSAALMPDAKVPYFPYRAENDDEDNDEGNEFDDDGFYDPTSNFAKYNNDVDLSVNDLAHSEEAKRNNNDLQINDIDRSKLFRNSNDKISLGSDSDSVLSSAEGVDDNLMYNSRLRNRRTSKNSDRDVSEMKMDQPLHSTSVIANVIKKDSDNYIHAPNYRENDAFGPLPKNNEGDLGRYKRIRRLKQSHTSEEDPSSVS